MVIKGSGQRSLSVVGGYSVQPLTLVDVSDLSCFLLLGSKDCHVADLDVTDLSFSGPGFRSMRQMLCGEGRHHAYFWSDV